MRLDWNDIRARAAEFSRDWHDAAYEKGETQSFYNDFFEVFGVPRRRVASFERAVKPRPGERGFIDLFWPGKLLVEQKSAGRDLKPAKKQALDYFPGLRDDELPRYVRRARAAHVHCVIIGLARREDEPREKRLFSYEEINGDPVETRHTALTAYLTDAGGLRDRNMVVRERSSSLSNVPKMLMAANQ